MLRSPSSLETRVGSTGDLKDSFLASQIGFELLGLIHLFVFSTSSSATVMLRMIVHPAFLERASLRLLGKQLFLSRDCKECLLKFLPPGVTSTPPR